MKRTLLNLSKLYIWLYGLLTIADNWLGIIISVLLKPLHLCIKRVIESCEYYVIKYK